MPGFSPPFAGGPSVIQGYGPVGAGWDGSGAVAMNEGAFQDIARGAYSGHPGVDFTLPDFTPLRAVKDGVVTLIRNWTAPGHPTGYAVALSAPSGETVVYGHVHFLPGIVSGQHVSAGQEIAQSGGVPGELGAGWSSGAHLHLEVRAPGGKTVDPVTYLHAISGGQGGAGDWWQSAINAVGQSDAAKGANAVTNKAGDIAGAVISPFRWVTDHGWQIFFTAAGVGLMIAGLAIYSKTAIAQAVTA